MEFMLFKKYLGFLRKQNTKFNMKYIALSFYYRDHPYLQPQPKIWARARLDMV